MTVIDNVPSWSTSTIELFHNCPYWYFREKVKKDKRREFAGEAAEHGQYLHKRMEERLRDKRPLPSDLLNKYPELEDHAQRLEALGGDMLVEHQMAINRQLEPTDWFAPDAWGRAAADVLIRNGNEITVVDWKTGRVKKPTLQSHVLAFITMCHFRDVRRITTEFVFVKANKIEGETYEAGDFAFLAKYIADQMVDIARAYEHSAWPRNPTGLCAWCPVDDCQHKR